MNWDKKLILLTYCSMIISTTMAMDQIQNQLMRLSDHVRRLNAHLDTFGQQARFITMPWLWENPAKNLYQIQVLEQAGSELPRDDVANSGYHALKNGLYTVEVIKGKISESTFSKAITMPKKYIELLNPWKETVRQFRSKIPTIFGPILTTWLREEDIKDLIVTSVAEYQDYFTIIKNSRPFNEKHPLVQKFKAEPTFNHIIILGSAKEHPDVDFGPYQSSLHWITLAINKINGNAHYLIMDSLRNDRTTSPDILRLIDILEGK